MNLRQNNLLIICDASPLILLAKINLISLLKTIAKEVWIPTAVWNEIMIHSDSHPEIEGIKIFLSNSIRDPNPIIEHAFQLQVDKGEAAALALASVNPDACLLMDDIKGRTIAKLQGIRVIGLVGLLVKAKHWGLVNELKPIFSDLKARGWFISAKLIQQALTAAGEEN